MPKNKKEINGHATLEVVTLYEAYNTDGNDFKYHSTIGYYLTATVANSARGSNTFSNVRKVDALKVYGTSTNPDAPNAEPCYYILAQREPVKANVNFDELAKKLKADALAKLSDTDKIALGLVKPIK